MQPPTSYKTQQGLINALSRLSEQPMTVSRAWWYENATYALVHNWGWEKEKAAKFVAAYHPHASAYRAHS